MDESLNGASQLVEMSTVIESDDKKLEVKLNSFKGTIQHCISKEI